MAIPEIGTLRKRVVLEMPTTTTSASGAIVEVWSQYRTCYASLEPMNSKESRQADSNELKKYFKVCLRYFSSLEPTDRLALGSRLFYIDSMANWNELNLFWELVVFENNAATGEEVS